MKRLFGTIGIILALAALAAPAIAWRHGATVVVAGPTLSAQSTTVQGWSDVRGYVTTNTASGTLYSVVQNGTIAAPSATQIKTCKAGDNTTPAACTSGSIIASGAQGPVKLGCTQSTCLAPLTSYKLYFVHTAAADGNIVNVAFTTGGQFQLVLQDDTTSPIKWNDNPNVTQWNAVRANLMAFITATFSPPVNVAGTVNFGWQYRNGGVVGCNAASQYAVTTNGYNTATTGIRAKILALPNQNTIQSSAYSFLAANDPTGHGNTYYLNYDLANFLTTGFTSVSTLVLGWVGFCNQTWDLTPDGTVTSGGVPLWKVMHHEVTEVLGRWSGADGTAPTILDAMRYGSLGVVKTSIGSGVAYPSSDNGATSFYGSTFGYDNASNCNNGGGDCGDLDGNTGSAFNATGGSGGLAGNPPLPADMKLWTSQGFTLSEKGQTCMEQPTSCTPF